MIRKSLSLATLAIFVALACTSGFAQDLKPNADPGQVEFVSALDAAWVRVLASGQFRAILNDPAYAAQPQGTLPVEHTVNMSDCLPYPEGTLYPEGEGITPGGLLDRVIQTGEVNRCVIQGVPSPGDTTNFFRHADAVEEAIFDELASHYEISGGITRNDVVIPPFLSSTLTDRLNDGTCDYINQVNALGGETNLLRRRDTRLFTCTLVSSGQFIHVPKKDRGGGLPSTKHIKSIGDLQDDPSLKICTGPLSTQLSNRYFPDHTVDTIFFSPAGDMGECAERVLGAGYCDCPFPFGCPTPPNCAPFQLVHDDVFMSSLPDLRDALALTPYSGKTKGIDTKIVAGTPLWVAIEEPDSP
jgi:hypothetical protein